MRRTATHELVGEAWLQSDARTRWETRVMRRRVPLYKAAIGALRLLNRLSGGPDRPSLEVTSWERYGPHGTTFVMHKLETMVGRTSLPPGSAAELHARTSLASRLARTLSADEWPQIIAEYERRKAGLAPQFRYSGHRPLNAPSHALMDRAWVTGEIETREYQPWIGDVKYNNHGALYSTFFTHGGARDFPGAEANPGYRKARVRHDVEFRQVASKRLEKEILRKARLLRARQLGKFVAAEIKYALAHRSRGAQAAAAGPPGAERAPEPARPRAGTGRPADPYTPEVVAAIADFVKPEPLRSATARGEAAPRTTRAQTIAIDVVAKGLGTIHQVAIGANPAVSASGHVVTAPGVRQRRGPGAAPSPPRGPSVSRARSKQL